MQIELELLAPAKNRDIGIAAIDCGADAVYIAGPQFGAREGAGNPISEIAELAAYARQFGVKVYMTVNTILYDHELEEAKK
jgi:putative protease